MGENENPISSNREVREKGIQKLKWIIDRAHDMESEILCGPFHSAHSVFTRAAASEQEYQWAAEALRIAGDHAKQAGVMLALEAVNRFENYLASCIDQLVYLVELTDHPNVGAMYDTH